VTRAAASQKKAAQRSKKQRKKVQRFPAKRLGGDRTIEAKLRLRFRGEIESKNRKIGESGKKDPRKHRVDGYGAVPSQLGCQEGATAWNQKGFTQGKK